MKNYSPLKKENVKIPGCRHTGLLARVRVQIIREELRIFTRLHKLQQHRGGRWCHRCSERGKCQFFFSCSVSRRHV